MFGALASDPPSRLGSGRDRRSPPTHRAARGTAGRASDRDSGLRDRSSRRPRLRRRSRRRADRRDRLQQAVAARVLARVRRRRVDDHRPVPRPRARPDHGRHAGAGADPVHDAPDAEDGRDHAIVVTLTLAAGWQLSTKLGTNLTVHPLHGWVVASMIIVGVMSVIALGLLEPANIAVLIELKKPRPNPEVIEHLMKRFVYSAGVLGVMQIAPL